MRFTFCVVLRFHISYLESNVLMEKAQSTVCLGGQAFCALNGDLGRQSLKMTVKLS
jgi:hypothetical protein